MADKVDKPKKKAKPKKDEKGVLAALPSTRPQRIGTRRAAPKTGSSSAAAKPRSSAAATRTASSSAAKTSTGAKKRSAPKTAASRPTAARPKAAAPHTFEPTLAAESAARAAETPRPRPVSEGAPGIGTGGSHRDERSPESARPSGVEVASTAVKAAGEVAQLGLTIGGHLLKRVVDRIPRP
jgi:hypothetical protein